MSSLNLIVEAIIALKEYNKGSSRVAIKQYIEHVNKIEIPTALFRISLNSGVESGILLRKGSKYGLPSTVKPDDTKIKDAPTPKSFITNINNLEDKMQKSVIATPPIVNSTDINNEYFDLIRNALRKLPYNGKGYSGTAIKRYIEPNNNIEIHAILFKNALTNAVKLGKLSQSGTNYSLRYPYW